jgi:hypothetical protein
MVFGISQCSLILLGTYLYTVYYIEGIFRLPFFLETFKLHVWPALKSIVNPIALIHDRFRYFKVMDNVFKRYGPIRIWSMKISLKTCTSEQTFWFFDSDDVIIFVCNTCFNTVYRIHVMVTSNYTILSVTVIFVHNVVLNERGLQVTLRYYVVLCTRKKYRIDRKQSCETKHAL